MVLNGYTFFVLRYKYPNKFHIKFNFFTYNFNFNTIKNQSKCLNKLLKIEILINC